MTELKYVFIAVEQITKTFVVFEKHLHGCVCGMKHLLLIPTLSWLSALGNRQVTMTMSKRQATQTPS